MPFRLSGQAGSGDGEPGSDQIKWIRCSWLSAMAFSMYVRTSSQTATIPAPAPANSRSGADSDCSPDQVESSDLNVPYDWKSA
jgi:hypothetical protein